MSQHGCVANSRNLNPETPETEIPLDPRNLFSEWKHYLLKFIGKGLWWIGDSRRQGKHDGRPRIA